MLTRTASGWPEVAWRHRRGAQVGHAVQRFVQGFHNAGVVQHVQGATGTLNRLLPPQHIRPARGDQYHVGEPHGFHSAGGCAYVAGVAGVNEDEAGFQKFDLTLVFII